MTTSEGVPAHRNTLSRSALNERDETSWGSLAWLASSDRGGVDLTLGHVSISPGCANPRHRHDGSDEIVVLLEGSIDHDVGAETLTLGAGDVLIVPAGIPHRAVNTGETEAVMIVAYPTGHRDFTPVD